MGLRPTSLTRRRWAAGSRSSATGEWTSGATTDTSYFGSMQPMPEEEWSQIMGEGRVTDPRIIFCDLAHTAGDPRTGQEPDHVQIGSVWYEVRFVRDHSRGVKPHYEVGVTRVQES